MPLCAIRQDDFREIKSSAEANNVGIALLNFLDKKDFRICGCLAGLDSEWNPFDGTSDITHTLALSIEGKPVYVFNLTEMKVTAPMDFPEQLKKFLEDIRIMACGRNVGVDLARLSKLGVVVPYRVELRQLALEVDEKIVKTGLADLAAHFFKVHMDKGPRIMDWSASPLPPVMLKYAALDGLMSRLLGRLLMRMSQQQPINVDTIQVGHVVEIHISRKVVARGKILFIGGQQGVARQWGAMIIGEGKALIELTEVLVPGQQPPFDYTNEKQPPMS